MSYFKAYTIFVLGESSKVKPDVTEGLIHGEETSGTNVTSDSSYHTAFSDSDQLTTGKLVSSPQFCQVQNYFIFPSL